MKKTLLALLAIGTIGLPGCGPQNQEIELTNFPVQDARVVERPKIETAGTVVEIDWGRSDITGTITNPDGTVTYTGKIDYRIAPNKSLIPSSDRPFANTPEMQLVYGPNGTYWHDSRPGSFKVERK